MDPLGGLIPHPRIGANNPLAAGFDGAQSEKPIAKYVRAFRPGGSSPAYSIMLGLLETVRNLVLSGHEPAPFLVCLLRDRGPVMIAGSAAELRRVQNQYGPVSVAFEVSAQSARGGVWLHVSEPTGQTGYYLEQFCLRKTGSGYEALPYCWRRASASSAYQSTSGLIPYWGFRNSSLLNHLIS